MVSAQRIATPRIAIANPRLARRRDVAAHFKVTLKTPSGEQTIECSGDTYILDAAEVRRCSVRARAPSGEVLGVAPCLSDRSIPTCRRPVWTCRTPAALGPARPAPARSW
jgi:hypothetical protein